MQNLNRPKIRHFNSVRKQRKFQFLLLFDVAIVCRCISTVSFYCGRRSVQFKRNPLKCVPISRHITGFSPMQTVFFSIIVRSRASPMNASAINTIFSHIPFDDRKNRNGKIIVFVHVCSWNQFSRMFFPFWWVKFALTQSIEFAFSTTE